MNFELQDQEQYDFKNKTLSILLLIYIYLPFIDNILENAFGIGALPQYILMLVLFGVGMITTWRSFNASVLLFWVCFFIVTLINIIVVSYGYYAFIESFQALIHSLVVLTIVSSGYFSLDDFLKKWIRFSRFGVFLVILSVGLLRAGFVPYSIFTGICVPNTFALSFGILEGSNSKKIDAFICAFNIVIIGILGGRTAAVACLCMLIIAFLISSKVKLRRKVFFIALVFIAGYLLITYLPSILTFLQGKMQDMGIRSRTVQLLIQQLRTGDIYYTRRDIIYEKCINFIKQQYGLPGGFGVVLKLTDGDYYYAHNILLQLLITFGYIGTIVAVIIYFVRLYMVRNIYPKKEKHLIYFMAASFLIISLMGSSIWIHYLSTISCGLLFFGSRVKCIDA